MSLESSFCALSLKELTFYVLLEDIWIRIETIIINNGVIIFFN